MVDNRRKRIVISLIISFLLIVTSWAIWEISSIPSESDTVVNDDTRVFSYISVDGPIMQADGNRVFPFGSDSCSMLYINQTPWIGDVNSIVSISMNFTLSYKTDVKLGSIILDTFIILYDADLDEIDTIGAWSTSIPFGVTENTSKIHQSIESHYAIQLGEEYYLGLLFGIHISGTGSISGAASDTYSSLSIHSLKPKS